MRTSVDDDRRRHRLDLLRSCGASDDVAEEVLAYTGTPLDAGRTSPLALPLPDELHLEAWEEYAADSRVLGAVPALARRFAQLRFPIESGISQSDDYRAATRRGVAPPPGVRVALRRPESITLTIVRTMAGRLPIVVAPDRDDFVALVRAFTARNEPETVPPSMGACIVTGLTNWDRVGRYRARFEAERGVQGDEAAWAAEFPNLAAQKPLYQDRFIILSRGPYSAIGAGAVGLDEESWLDRSLAIRRAHECTHYFTLRVFGQMRNHLLDELLADAAGLLDAFGHYEARLALLFFGLEDYPSYRAGGRFENYLGASRLSETATGVLQTVLARSIGNIEALMAANRTAPQDFRIRLLLAMFGLAIEEVASTDLAARAADAARALPVDAVRTFE